MALISKFQYFPIQVEELHLYDFTQKLATGSFTKTGHQIT